MTTRTYTDERRWANTDPSRHLNRDHRWSGRWFNAWIWCLQHDDEEAAHLIRIKNDPEYAEECEERAASLFPVTSAPIQSLSEAESERDAEAA